MIAHDYEASVGCLCILYCKRSSSCQRISFEVFGLAKTSLDKVLCGNTKPPLQGVFCTCRISLPKPILTCTVKFHTLGTYLGLCNKHDTRHNVWGMHGFSILPNYWTCHLFCLVCVPREPIEGWKQLLHYSQQILKLFVRQTIARLHLQQHKISL